MSEVHNPDFSTTDPGHSVIRRTSQYPAGISHGNIQVRKNKSTTRRLSPSEITFLTPPTGYPLYAITVLRLYWVFRFAAIDGSTLQPTVGATLGPLTPRLSGASHSPLTE